MQTKKIKKRFNILINIFYYITTILVGYLFIKYILPFFWPFLFGFLIAFVLTPISNKLSRKLKINKKICRVCLVVLVILIFFSSVFFVSLKIIAALKTFANSTEDIYLNYLVPIKNACKKNFEIALNKIVPNVNVNANEILSDLTKKLINIISTSSQTILKQLAKVGTSIPSFLIDLSFAIISAIYFCCDYEKIVYFIFNLFIISAIYFCCDYEKIVYFIFNLFPKKIKKLIIKTKKMTITTIIKYLKAYAVLMILCCIILTIAFLIVKIKNPIGSAALISLFDGIPLIGSGIIIIPWTVSLFVMGHFNLGLYLLIVFIAINLTRSFLEAKILGDKLGIHPIATLISIYIGAKLIGFMGIVVAPVATPIIYTIFKDNNKNIP